MFGLFYRPSSPIQVTACAALRVVEDGDEGIRGGGGKGMGGRGWEGGETEDREASPGGLIARLGSFFVFSCFSFFLPFSNK